MDPFKTDDAATARTLMIHELSEALLGESWARSDRPEQVWSELLGMAGAAAGVVASSDPERLRRNNAELLAARRVVEAAQGLGALVAGEELTRAIIAYERTVFS